MLKAKFKGIWFTGIQPSLNWSATCLSTFRYVYKTNTTNAGEIAAHFQEANISLDDVTCDTVVIGKLQETCKPIQVKNWNSLIWSSNARRTRTKRRTKDLPLECWHQSSWPLVYSSTYGFRSSIFLLVFCIWARTYWTHIVCWCISFNLFLSRK